MTAKTHTLLTLGVSAVVAASLLGLRVAPASASGTVGWSIRAAAEPTHFSANDRLRCEEPQERCDRYQLLVMNVGDEASSGTITVTDKLPAGIKPMFAYGGYSVEGRREWSCGQIEPVPNQWTETCEFRASSPEEPVPAGGYAPFITIEVSAPTAAMSGSLKNEAAVTGGGTAAVASTSEETPISSQAPEFGVEEFAFEPVGVEGAPIPQAGAHPWEVTASIASPSVIVPPGIEGHFIQAVENLKSIAVELPAGFVGDPQAVARCTETQLRAEACPAGSRVGTFAFRGGLLGGSSGEFVSTGAGGGAMSAVYNMVPDGGYPAQFGFTVGTVPVELYASVVHGADGYHLRITSTDIPAVIEVVSAAITFFGDPGKLNGSPSEPAFLTSPVDCSAGALSSRVELESLEDPVSREPREATAYPQLTGCDLLHFNPSLALAPSAPAEGGTTQADAPSGYTVDLKVPQTSAFSELATPELRDATVTLPPGVSISPPAGQGLVGCRAEGPEGINIGSDRIGPKGRDEGDPEATELGAGHPGGNGSPYDDGFYHTAHGHCPSASTLGTVEVFTPLLASPLQGHVYLAQPKCGGEGQPACTEASATNGELFGLYVEAEGSGVIVKLPGAVAANPSTGQLTATFKENPQLPFSELKLRLHSGARAPLANPQSCGSFATSSTLTSWGGQEASEASPPFGVDWDGKGGACPASVPFAPGFVAGTTIPTADAFSPFVLSFSRNDREQDLSGLSVTLPPGLMGKIAGIPLCGEAQANAGTCGPESQVGSASVLAGPGEHPLYVSGGRVYLTTGYKGQPFGLSIVVPAVAGPFNLGDVVVRASIHIDPTTAQITVTTDPLPQSKDGVPLRLRTVYTEINRPGFTFNPTNCAQQKVTGTIAGALPNGSPGSTAAVSSPFAAAGCKNLPFKPSFSISTSAKTSRQLGAALHVQLTYPNGSFGNSTNIRSVKVNLPKRLPSRLTTLQKACPDSVFNANPAACPAASIVGHAKAVTPVLPVPLEGPAYFVSHGGEEFPDLIVVLQGDNVTIDLVGTTFIKNGITSSTFKQVPDVPVGSFELTLPEGPFSALAANGDLCTASLVMPTAFTAQNGATLKQSTSIEVQGCPYALRIIHRSVSNHTLTLNVIVPQGGRLSASGKGLTSASKSAAGRQTLVLTLKERRAGKLGTSVLLRFTPAKGKQPKILRKTLHVTFG